MPEAKITLAVDGADASVAAIDRVKGALASVGGVSGIVTGTVNSIATSLSTLATDAIRIVGAVNNINLAGKVEEVRALDLAVQRLSTAGGGAVADLNAQMTAVGRATNQSELAVRGLADSLGKATYDFRSAMEAQKGLGEQALFTGRTPQEVQQLGAALHNVLGVTGDTTLALGKLNAQAQALGTVGGPAAMADTFTQLAPTLAQSVSGMEGAREKAMAFVGALTSGMQPGRAAGMGASVLSGLQSSYFDINYTLGYDILDENGQVRDPGKVIRDLAGNMKHRGLGRWQQMQAMRSFFGVEAGSRVFHAIESGDLSEERINALVGLAPSTAATDATMAYQASTEGRAEAARLERDRQQRDLARSVKGYQDSMTEMFKDNPIAGAAAGGLLTAGGLSLARGLPGIVKGGMELVGFGGGAAGAGGAAATGGGVALDVAALEGAAMWGNAGLTAPGAAMAGPLALILGGIAAQGGALADIGEDRDAMGAAWRAAHGVGDSIEGDAEFSVEAQAKRRAARAADRASKAKTLGVSEDDYGALAAAADASSGDIEKAWRFLSPDMKKKINEGGEGNAQGEALRALVNNAGAVRDEARVQGDELNKALRAGGPLPVVIVGTQAPVAKN